MVTSRVYIRTVCPIRYEWVKDLLPKLHEVDVYELSSVARQEVTDDEMKKWETKEAAKRQQGSVDAFLLSIILCTVFISIWNILGNTTIYFISLLVNFVMIVKKVAKGQSVMQRDGISCWTQKCRLLQCPHVF